MPNGLPCTLIRLFQIAGYYVITLGLLSSQFIDPSHVTAGVWRRHTLGQETMFWTEGLHPKNEKTPEVMYRITQNSNTSYLFWWGIK